jgi:hypothetical protein
MQYKLCQWPPTVYPKEVDEFPDAREAIDVALMALAKYGPSPEGYNFKPLGKARNGLWQLNIRTSSRQVRILYCPYGNVIVLFRIHKKSAPQEQKKAYKLAIKRKTDLERLVKKGRVSIHDSLNTIH